MADTKDETQRMGKLVLPQQLPLAVLVTLVVLAVTGGITWSNTTNHIQDLEKRLVAVESQARDSKLGDAVQHMQIDIAWIKAKLGGGLPSSGEK